MSAVTLPPAGGWIRGITIRQPWATCILAGKNVENRPVSCSWRGWVLLHAGKTLERAVLRDRLVASAIRGRELHLGAVVGVARLTGCHTCDAGSSGYQNLRNGQLAWRLEGV